MSSASTTSAGLGGGSLASGRGARTVCSLRPRSPAPPAPPAPPRPRRLVGVEAQPQQHRRDRVGDEAVDDQIIGGALVHMRLERLGGRRARLMPTGDLRVDVLTGRAQREAQIHPVERRVGFDSERPCHRGLDRVDAISSDERGRARRRHRVGLRAVPARQVQHGPAPGRRRSERARRWRHLARSRAHGVVEAVFVGAAEEPIPVPVDAGHRITLLLAEAARVRDSTMDVTAQRAVRSVVVGAGRGAEVLAVALLFVLVNLAIATGRGLDPATRARARARAGVAAARVPGVRLGARERYPGRHREEVEASHWGASSIGASLTLRTFIPAG